MQNDLIKELGTNFIEYAVAVNTDRSIPDAKSGLKPVAKRILYCAFKEGFSSAKPHVKCADIVGRTIATWHPHGDTSVYEALVRLSRPWVMRYPLIDFHGNNGNRDGDPPAAYRYTESRLSKVTEDGLLCGIKKKNVDFIPNFSETEDEPITLPSLFPNLLCNPNTGIGVAMACNWLPHNLKEVAQAIFDYMDGKEASIPGPDFPTGGLIINKKDLPSIIKRGHGSVKLRGKYKMEDNKIVFYEIPYGIVTEPLMEQIGEACNTGKIVGVSDIRNESNKNGFRLVIECEKNANIAKIITQLFKETDLQTSISYNQVALVDKTPTELGLDDCLKIYVDHNTECIVRETEFDKQKTEAKIEIADGLLKALEDIDNIIALIKKSESSAKAKDELIAKYGFTDNQAKAIIDMKLGRLAGLEKIELQNERAELMENLKMLNLILSNPKEELRTRLTSFIAKYGDERKTEITQIEEKKEDKEIAAVEPEKCVVVLTESGTIKRIPAASFKTQRRNGKGVKTQEDITSMIIRTNTIDSLMVFSNKGKMYRLIVDNIPVGTNASKGTLIKALIEMEPDEQPSVIYSIYRDTDAKYVLFTTKGGLVKKTSLSDYIGTKKKTGIGALTLKGDDKLANVNLIKDEDIYIITKMGQIIKFSSKEIGATGRMTSGVKGINLNDGDEVVATIPVRDNQDMLAVFTDKGYGKRMEPKELSIQKRGGKGAACYKVTDTTGCVSAACLVSNEDKLLVVGTTNSICINASDLSIIGKSGVGSTIIKNNKITSVSKI